MTTEPLSNTTLYRKKGRKYIPTTLHEQDAWGYHGLMIVAAFRYCLGRMTYMPSVCADWIIRHWDEFPERERIVIQRELEEAFTEDNKDRADIARNDGFGYTLGHDCDRRAWSRVREIWKGAP